MEDKEWEKMTKRKRRGISSSSSSEWKKRKLKAKHGGYKKRKYHSPKLSYPTMVLDALFKVRTST